MAKRTIADSMGDEALRSAAEEDVQNALRRKSPEDGLVRFGDASSPLEHYIAMRDRYDYLNGDYQTTAFLDTLPDLGIAALQSALNEMGATDRFGNPLKTDGLFGPKTEYASAAISTKGKPLRKIQFYEDGKTWACTDELLGMGILPSGEVVCNPNASESDKRFMDLLSKELTGDLSKAEKAELAQFRKSGEKKYEKLLDYYTIPDITDRMFELMSEADSKYTNYNNPINIIKYFVDYFELNKNKGYTDLKSRDEFNFHELFIFRDEVVSRDDLGNIFAGYFAKVYGMPLDILHLGAGIYQARGGNINWDWFSTAFDDPRDYRQMCIRDKYQGLVH